MSLSRPLGQVGRTPSAASTGRGWKDLIRDNGLSLVCFGLFVFFLIGQSVAGFYEHNQEARAHAQPVLAYGTYLLSGHFLESVFENWESEFLQMAAYVLLTSCLIQRGSAESKKPDEENPQDRDPALGRDAPDAPAPVKRGGWALRLYGRSFSLSLGMIFLLSFAGHAIAGSREYNQEQIEHGQQEVSVMGYLATARFWFESLQNWQSEFLAVFALVVLSIWLRERGSPESKPVAAPHSETGAD